MPIQWLLLVCSHSNLSKISQFAQNFTEQLELLLLTQFASDKNLLPAAAAAVVAVVVDHHARKATFE